MYIFIAGLLLLAVAVGGVWWRVTRVDFLPRLATWLFQQLWPIIWKEIIKQMSPEQIVLMIETHRSGGHWDFAKRQPKEWGH